MVRVAAKWGFGNAPLKNSHREKTEAAIRTVLKVLAEVPDPSEIAHLDAISHVKGQFTRVVKQDQWDWYTVWSLLGRPSRQPANRISKKLGELRTAIKAMDRQAADRIRSELEAIDILRYLDNFLAGGRKETLQDGPAGFIYILSTRSQPQFLKIGMTQRSVEARVKEINGVTGVVIPYGVRAVWKVDNALEREKEVHALLAEYRVRADREFFEIEFNDASRIINDHLGARRIFKNHGK